MMGRGGVKDGGGEQKAQVGGGRQLWLYNFG